MWSFSLIKISNNKFYTEEECEQINYLENDGYNVDQMWECDWKKIKAELSNKLDLETQARHQNINPRDAFLRTN